MEAAPAARLAESVGWTGSELIVWGGRACLEGRCEELGESRLVASGGLYDPWRDVWQPTALDGAPSPRESAVTVWAGDRLLIWSGLHGQMEKGGLYWPPLQDGAWYRPDVDEWQPLPTDGAPSPRAGAVSVWTGREILIWGGGAPSTEEQGLPTTFDDGARLDPETGAWTAIATLERPEDPEAMSPLALWTGTHLILWDGRRTHPPRPGWRYDPEADAWEEIAPQEGEGGGACGIVWTGDELLAFGHDSFSRYDPDSDAWTVRASDVTLCARPVWTGSEVLLWRPGGSPPGANARFDPATETVTPIERDGAPTPRTSFHVFWTGQDMLVWGGQDEAATNTGALYRPPPR